MRRFTLAVGAFALIVCLSQTQARAEESASATRRAKVLFGRGETEYAAGRFRAAAELYQQAYDEKPLPGFHFNLGQCYRQLGEYDKAIEHYEQYLASSRTPSRREEVEQLLAECREHKREQELANRETREVESAKSREPHVTSEDRAHEPTPPLTVSSSPTQSRSSGRLRPPIFWTAVGVTGVLVVTTIVTGSLALAKSNQFNDPKTPYADLAGLKSSGEGLRTAADVSLGLSLAGAAASAALFFFTDFIFTDFRPVDSASAQMVLLPVHGGAITGWQGTY